MAKAKNQSMTVQAYERIRGDILSGQLTSNRKIKISDLVTTLGLSLGSVREALFWLTSEGLVSSETNKGFRVAEVSQSELEDLTRTRVLIEVECMKGAIRNGDLKWETGIVSTLFELSRLPLRDAQTPARLNPDWADAHGRFHEALVSACDSPWLLRIRQQLFVQSERYRVATLPFERQLRDSYAEHKAIADAAIARDVTAATSALRDHLLLTQRIIVESYPAARAPRRTAGKKL